MKFVVSHALCKEGMNMLSDAQVYVAENGDCSSFAGELLDADAVILRLAKMDGSVISQCENLKVIGRTGVGFDLVDVKAATAAGIPVVITPGANSRSVAEHAVAMMMALSKNLYNGQVETLGGNFNTVRNSGRQFEILGKQIGIIGLGAIGRETAKICGALGMRCHGFDPFLSREEVEARGCVHWESFEEMIKECDVITLHLPLNADTKNMITRKHLEMMKPTALLINCARGGLVNEKDLSEALTAGTIKGAGFDVFETEPPQPDNPLLNAPNLILSPHSGAQTTEAVINMAAMCIDGCKAVLRGERWPHVADPAVYDHPRWTDR